jgi:excisionase family DNA binding protein
MALRSDELHYSLKHLNGMLTTREAAEQLRMSYWHFMHLVESGRIPGVRIVDRWLFSPTDLDEYRRRKYGELEDMARLALETGSYLSSALSWSAPVRYCQRPPTVQAGGPFTDRFNSRKSLPSSPLLCCSRYSR